MNKWIISVFLIGSYCMAYAQVKQDRVQVTIWVHGTQAGFNLLSNILPSLAVYLKHVDGLYRPHECAQEYIYRKVVHTISQSCPIVFPQEHFYLFCWSGILSHDARVKAAQELHTALNNLIITYRQNGKECAITLITHSPGGNVALNLVNIVDVREYIIDKLVLLAVPVQEATKDYVDNDLFKDVCSIYSECDMFQVGDQQGREQFKKRLKGLCPCEKKEPEVFVKRIPFFSERYFPSQKVKHIQVIHNTLFGERPIGHSEFLFPYFTQYIPAILEQASEYDFLKDTHMIFNLEKASLVDTFFD